MKMIKNRLLMLLGALILSCAFFSGQAFADKCSADLTAEELDQLYEG